jgi:hypothetical protein
LRKITKIAVIVLFSLLAIAMVLIYLFSSGMGPAPLGYIDSSFHEKITIPATYYNATDNSVYVFVQALDDSASNATFIHALIKDKKGYLIDNVPIRYTLSDLELTTLKNTPNITLTSGTYTVTLITQRENQFVSLLFNVTMAK